MNSIQIQLGQSDLSVTPICLSTMTLGQQVGEPTAHTIPNRLFERGVLRLQTEVHALTRAVSIRVGAGS